MSTQTRRTSAAAARRLRQQLTTPTAPSPLPEHLAALLAEFEPTSPLCQEWPRLRPLVEEVMGRSRIRGADSFRKHLTHLGYFLLWADRQDLPLSPALVVRAHTDEYTRTGMPTSSEKSRSDRRARLRRLADQVNPDQAPDKGVTLPRPTIKPPYLAAEMRLLVRAARTQPTPEQTRRACLCIGLGAGAGLDSSDFRGLRGANIVDLGPGGLSVHVHGRNARMVPVRRSMEELVRRGVHGIEAGGLLLGRVEDRRNLTANALSDIVTLGSCPRIEQSRLRTTWLATMLEHGVRVDVVMRAAGLQTARTLPDLLPHLEPLEVGQAHSMLRLAQENR